METETTKMASGNDSSILNPYKELSLFQRREKTVCMLPSDEEQLKKIEAEVPKPLILFQTMMKNLQNHVAVQHAKKVKENKESLSINGTLRKNYGDKYMRHFPDPILNTTLTKKDFTLPFLIDVKQIDQDCGPQPTEDNESEGKRKLEQGSNGTSYEPPAKRHFLDVKGKPVPANRITAARPEGKASVVVRSAQLPMKQLPVLTPAITPIHGLSISRVQVPRLTTRQGTSRPYVPILPKPDGSTKPDMVIKPVRTFSGQSQNDAEEEFAPKIVNTIGSVVITPANEESPRSNGHSSTVRAPPKLLPVNASVMDDAPVVKKKRVNPTSGKGSTFLGCKQCGKTFPCQMDQLFRNHMIIHHCKDMTEEDIRNAKITVSSWYQCRNCSIMLLNNLNDHHQTCCNSVPLQEAYDAVPVSRDSEPLICGLCKTSFESRIWLRKHLEEVHPETQKKVIVDPCFRCAVCLQFFTDVSKCILHAYECRNTRPSEATAQELAQKNLHCDICSKKHSKIRETLFCYQMKNLLRCVLCLHVSISRQGFFTHLKTYHNRKNVMIPCPFCGDDIERTTRTAFDHFIDNHYNLALKKAGEAALLRGKNFLQSQSAAFKSAGLNPLGGAERRPNIQRKLPMLRAASAVTAIQNGALPPGMNTSNISTIRVPASQILQLNNSNLLAQSNLPPLAAGSVVRPIIISSKVGTIPRVPVGYTVVPASSLEAFNSSNITLEPVEGPVSEDSILGM